MKLRCLKYFIYRQASSIVIPNLVRLSLSFTIQQTDLEISLIVHISEYCGLPSIVWFSLVDRLKKLA